MAPPCRVLPSMSSESATRAVKQLGAALANAPHAASSGLFQFGQDGRSGKALQFDELVPRGVAAQDFHTVPRTAQLLRQQTDQCLIRRRIHWRRGHLYAQFVAQRLADSGVGSARLKFDGERDAVGLNGEERG